MAKQQTNSLAHTKWMCKYHIIFTPKYRRKAVYNQYKADLRDILKQLCSYKGVEILEGHLMPDDIHMLVSIPPKISVSSFMGYLMGKSALMMMFDRHANLKYKFGTSHGVKREGQRLVARPSRAGLEPASRATRFTGGATSFFKRFLTYFPDSKKKRYMVEYY